MDRLLYMAPRTQPIEHIWAGANGWSFRDVRIFGDLAGLRAHGIGDNSVAS